jgi:phosphomevalonate kinase
MVEKEMAKKADNFVVWPQDMKADYDIKVDPSKLVPPAPVCWCGKVLVTCGIPDFIGDKSPDAVCTIHYECPEHGQDYQRKPYAGIAISGKARSGKSTLADMLVAKLGALWHVESLSDAVLEEFAKENWMIEYSEHGLDDLIERINKNKEAYRPQLIELGQRRRAEDPDYWIKRLPCRPNAIISNCRFRNGYDHFRNRDFYMVRMDALPEVREARGCPDLDDVSETDLDSIPLFHWDYVTVNNGSFAGLDFQADCIVKAVLHGMKPDCQCGCDCKTPQGDK